MKQSIWYEVEFQAEHKPDHEAHLRHVADTYFKGKGIIIRDGKIVV